MAPVAAEVCDDGGGSPHNRQTRLRWPETTDFDWMRTSNEVAKAAAVAAVVVGGTAAVDRGGGDDGEVDGADTDDGIVTMMTLMRTTVAGVVVIPLPQRSECSGTDGRWLGTTADRGRSTGGTVVVVGDHGLTWRPRILGD